MSGDFDQPNLVAALIDFPWIASARLRSRKRDEINGCYRARQIPSYCGTANHEKTAVISTFGHWDAMILTEGIRIILELQSGLVVLNQKLLRITVQIKRVLGNSIEFA
jgi:hypothetical protein